MVTFQIGAAWFPDASDFPELNGLNRYFHEFVQALAASGDEVVAAAYDVTRPPKIERLEVISLGRKANGPVKRFWLQRRVIGRCLGPRPDIAAFHYVPSAFPSLLELRRVPLVCHFHGPLSAEYRFENGDGLQACLLELMERVTLRLARHFIVLSRTFGDLLVGTFGVDPDRVSVVAGGVDARRFQIREDRREARLALGLPADRPLVLTVRQFLRRKGLSHLVEAAARLLTDRPDLSFAIVGSGALEADIRRQVVDKGIERQVTIVGPVPDATLPLWYRAADFTVVPTVALEGFGLSAIESLAAGTPALGTPVGGIPEVLEPLNASLVLSGSSTADLTRGLAEVLRGERPLPDAATCERYAAEQFDWSIVVPRIRAIYERVLDSTERQSR
jgi:glycosyltransferase involved in cell wall biosynthesis